MPRTGLSPRAPRLCADMPGRASIAGPPSPNLKSPGPAGLDRPRRPAGREFRKPRFARAIAQGHRQNAGHAESLTPRRERRYCRKIRAGDVLIRSTLRTCFGNHRRAEGREPAILGADRLKLAGEWRCAISAPCFPFWPPEDRPVAGGQPALSRPWPDRGRALPPVTVAAVANTCGGGWDSWHRAAVDLVRDLMGQDRLHAPYDLIQRLLIRHQGPRNACWPGLARGAGRYRRTSFCRRR